MSAPIVTPIELKAELDAGKSLFLLDVREDHELEVSKIEGVVHIPLGELEARYSEVPSGADVVVVCRSGMRSDRAAEFLIGHGYGSVRNLATGMNGWCTTVDPSQPVY
jgi:sulfur-carrier protein adenylyltransferase/sulfurtransferase